MTAHNTFDKPDVVKPADFNDAKPTDTGFTATVPAKSVVLLEIVG
jgi:alpha-N-arabinofuranosidase